MKKSFILHIDSLSILEKMPDTIAGKFIKILYEYQKTGVIPEMDFALEMAVTPFLLQFKRDAEKYTKIVNRNRNNGLKGGRPKIENIPEKPTGFLETQQNPTKPKKADNDNDSDNDSDNDNKKDINNINIKKTGFSFRKSLCELGINEKLVNDFLKNRKMKRLANTETAFNALKKHVLETNMPINDVFEVIVINGWGSFKKDWLSKKVAPKKEKMSLAEKMRIEHGIKL